MLYSSMMLVVAGSPSASASSTRRFRLRRPATNTTLALLVLACKWALAVAVLTGALRMAVPKPYLSVLQTLQQSSDEHAFVTNAPEALDYHGKRRGEVLRELEMEMASSRERAWTAGASDEGQRATPSMNEKNHSEEKPDLRWTERHERLWAQLWTLPVVLTRGRLGKEGAISCGGANGPAGAVVFREWRHIEAQVPGLAEHLPETQPTVGLGWRLNASRAAVRPTCAVVGNSGRLLKERHRAAVDAKDVVIRFNQVRPQVLTQSSTPVGGSRTSALPTDGQTNGPFLQSPGSAGYGQLFQAAAVEQELKRRLLPLRQLLNPLPVRPPPPLQAMAAPLAEAGQKLPLPRRLGKLHPFCRQPCQCRHEQMRAAKSGCHALFSEASLRLPRRQGAGMRKRLVCQGALEQVIQVEQHRHQAAGGRPGKMPSHSCDRPEGCPQGRVRGFESHVGSKSSVRLFNGPYADPLSPEEATIATLRDAAMREWMKSRKHRKQRFRKQLERSYLLDPEFICHAWEWVDRQGQKPSTGLVGVLMAARMCASVDVYGFQWRGYFNASVQPHYYDWERPKPGRENAHPFQLEADTLSVLQAAGKLVLH